MRVHIEKPRYFEDTYHTRCWRYWPTWMPFWFSVCRLDSYAFAFRIWLYWNRRKDDFIGEPKSMANGACIGMYFIGNRRP